jgi:hypothetical protein
MSLFGWAFGFDKHIFRQRTVIPDIPDHSDPPPLPTIQAVSSEPLVCFFYLLMRDKLPCGAVEDVLRLALDPTGAGCTIYSSKHLEAYARDIAARVLLAGQAHAEAMMERRESQAKGG